MAVVIGHPVPEERPVVQTLSTEGRWVSTDNRRPTATTVWRTLYEGHMVGHGEYPRAVSLGRPAKVVWYVLGLYYEPQGLSAHEISQISNCTYWGCALSSVHRGLRQLRDLGALVGERRGRTWHWRQRELPEPLWPLLADRSPEARKVISDALLVAYNPRTKNLS